MFVVLDNGRPAKYPDVAVSSSSWDNNIFDKWEDAVKYAQEWLGDYKDGIDFRPNTPVDYNGYGDTIEIKEIK